MCEGKETEVNYFSALKQEFGLTSVKVVGLRTIGRMIEKIRQEIKGHEPGDEIWCVVDHDERDAEIERLAREVKETARESRRKKLAIHEVVSIPCFEYWLLIHFEDTTRPFLGLSGRSACSKVIEALKSHLPDYKKNSRAIYDDCRDKLCVAMNRGKRPGVSQGHSSTDVGKLVARLRELGTN